MKIFDPRFYGNLNLSNFDVTGKLITIDIESSGISKNGYPIEVGWYSKDSSGSILIKPEPDWLENGFWCTYAETHVHGISKKMLLRKGIDVVSAAIRLNETLGNSVVVCDVVEFDGTWLTQLFSKANVIPSFKLIGHLELIDFKKRTGCHLVKSFSELQSFENKRHRAQDDAKQLHENMLKITESIA